MTAADDVRFIFLMPWSSSISQERNLSNTVIAGITSTAISSEELNRRSLLQQSPLARHEIVREIVFRRIYSQRAFLFDQGLDHVKCAVPASLYVLLESFCGLTDL